MPRMILFAGKSWSTDSVPAKKHFIQAENPMERLIRVGKVAPKDPNAIAKSRIGLGFEKLDRDVFDPEKAYDYVAKTGVKWARLYSSDPTPRIVRF